MKCDTCKNQAGENASQEYPYPTIYCTKGHWEGDGTGDPDDPNPGYDPWSDCEDYTEIQERINTIEAQD